MAVEGRMERVRHLIESVRELVKETRGDDKPTVRGKRLVSKACEYAVSTRKISNACETVTETNTCAVGPPRRLIRSRLRMPLVLA